MNGNYEWQQQQAKQRVQKQLRVSQQHRLSKQQKGAPQTDSTQSIIRLPLRLVTALFSLVR